MPAEALPPCRENIVLVGFMGSGKSSIGRLLARRLGFQFLDSDRLVIDRARMEIAEIFAKLGEPEFRNMETTALASVSHLKRCVLATGGGAPMREKNRALMREMGFVVGLTASPDVIYERVARNNKRPLLQTENPRRTMLNLLESRREAYVSAAHFTLDTTRLTHAEAVEEIVGAARRAFGWVGQRKANTNGIA